uniref:CARD domain-containing protein n=1 Tax=Salmo trutta TaxID=8032 RepID=A0A673Z776_SALTR
MISENRHENFQVEERFMGTLEKIVEKKTNLITNLEKKIARLEEKMSSCKIKRDLESCEREIEKLQKTIKQKNKELQEVKAYIEKSQTSSANPSILTGQAFITKHRMELVNRLGLLPPILTRLHVRGVLSQEEIEIVEIKPTKSQQNRALLNMVVRKGTRAQEYFYLALRESDILLVEDLCNCCK